jgi:Domain of unknown function (DUF4055)
MATQETGSSLSYAGKINLDISSAKDESQVNRPNDSYNWMSNYWREIDIVSDGFESAKTAAGSIVFQMYGESSGAYQSRLNHLDFLPLFSRLIDLSASMICRKAITVIKEEDAAESTLEIIEEHLENIDSLGNSIDVFVRDFLKLQMTYSIAGIFVDAPSLPMGERLSLADEKKMNLRPYWVKIDPRDLIAWRHERYGAEFKLVHLRIKSSTEIQVGEFGCKTIPIIKVYDLQGESVLCRCFQEMQKDGEVEWTENPDMRSEIRLPYIPYFAMNTNQQGLFVARPEMYELAILNINHARVSSDLMFALNLAAHPKLKRTRTSEFQVDYDKDESQLDLSPDKVLTPGVGEDYDWLSAPDTAFSALERKIEKYENDSQRLWTMMVLCQNTYAQSAQSKSIDSNQGDSILLKTVIALDSVLECCIQAHCDLMDVTKIGEDAPICLNANRELDLQRITVEMLREFSDMQIKGQISKRTVLDAAVRGQVLWEDFDVDAELKELEDPTSPVNQPIAAK